MDDRRIFELNVGCSFACYIQGEGTLLSSAAVCIVFCKESARLHCLSSCSNVVIDIKRD